MADLRPHSEDFTRNMFARLFAMDPSLRELFPAGMTAHRKMFFDVLDHVFSTIPEYDDHEELIEFLAQLGRDHRKYGLTDANYNTMAEAIVLEVHALYEPHGGLDEDDAAVVQQAAHMLTGVMRGGAHSDPTPARRSATVVDVQRPHPSLTLVRLVAREPMLFRPGQYIETQIPQVARQWRPYSVAMPPNTQGYMEFHVRTVPGGDVSNTIYSDTRAGDVWQFGQVHGSMRVEGDRPVTMIAGGTGIAPMRSILLGLAASANNPPVHLLVAARSPGQLYDAEPLTMLAATNPWLRITLVSDVRRDPWWLTTPAPGIGTLPLRHGSVVDAMGGLDLRGHRVLIAGPPAMIRAARAAATQAGADTEQVLSDPL